MGPQVFIGGYMCRLELSANEIAQIFTEDHNEDSDMDIDALLERLDNDYDKEEYKHFMRPLDKEEKKNILNKIKKYTPGREMGDPDRDHPILYSNLGAVINRLKELSYFDIDIEEVPLRIDDIEKIYYKVKISAAPDKKLSQGEIDILVRSLCPGDK